MKLLATVGKSRACTVAQVALVAALATAGLAGCPGNTNPHFGAAPCGQAGSFRWAHGYGSANQYNQVLGVAADASGGVYATGTFLTQASFDAVAVTSSQTVHTTVFVGRFDALGNPLWVHAYAATNSSEGVAVALDAAGNPYFAIHYAGAMDVEGHHFDQTPDGIRETSLLTRFNPMGELTWAREFAHGEPIVRGMAIAGTGRVVVTGTYAAPTQMTYGTVVIPPGSGSAMFVLAVDAQGEGVWAQTADDPGNAGAMGLGVAADRTGSVWVTGQVLDSATFGATRLATRGGFLARYDAAGALQWVREATSTEPNGVVPHGVAVDNDGNSYATGEFVGTVSFPGDGTPANPPQVLGVTQTGRDMFLVSYGPDGAPRWLRRGGEANGNNRGNAVAWDGAEGVYVAGFHQGPTRFDAMTAPANGNLFVARYDRAGAIRWVAGNDSGGGEGDTLAVRTATSDVIVGGDYGSPTASFGPIALASYGAENQLLAAVCNP